jgi:hypothetical protein
MVPYKEGAQRVSTSRSVGAFHRLRFLVAHQSAAVPAMTAAPEVLHQVLENAAKAAESSRRPIGRFPRVALLAGQGRPPPERVRNSRLARHVTRLLRIALPSAHNVFRVFSPHPNAARIASLIARELDLTERAARLGPKLALSKRAEIQCELVVVRRLLEHLGHRRSGPVKSS